MLTPPELLRNSIAKYYISISFYETKLTFSDCYYQIPLPYSGKRSTCYSDRLHDFSVTVPRYYKNVYVNSFFPRTARVWNSLSVECFPLTCNLNSFKSRNNRHLLTVGFF